jgi:hypothetical protein
MSASKILDTPAAPSHAGQILDRPVAERKSDDSLGFTGTRETGNQTLRGHIPSCLKEVKTTSNSQYSGKAGGQGCLLASLLTAAGPVMHFHHPAVLT